MNIGVLGGTFDPVHNGHLVLAEEARMRLSLSLVLFVPTGQPWLKMGKPILAAEHRLEMVRLAIAGSPGFKLSTVEVERAGPSYTVDTLAELRAQFGAGNEFFLIIGWDSLAELPRWHEPLRLITMCQLAVAPRPGYPHPDLEKLAAGIPGLSPRVILMEKPYVDISASDIRKRVAQGLPIHHLVPEPVAEYIRRHGLYLNL